MRGGVNHEQGSADEYLSLICNARSHSLDMSVLFWIQRKYLNIAVLCVYEQCSCVHDVCVCVAITIFLPTEDVNPYQLVPDNHTQPVTGSQRAVSAFVC